MKASNQFKQLFVSSKDMFEMVGTELNFKKKKTLFFDKNSETINYDALKIQNLDINEV